MEVARAQDTDLRTVCNKRKLLKKEKRAEHTYSRVRRDNRKVQKPRKRGSSQSDVRNSRTVLSQRNQEH